MAQKLHYLVFYQSIIGDESDCETIDFPVEVNARDIAHSEEILLHYNGSSEAPIPIFSKDEKPMDGPSTLQNTLTCPVKFICKVPPTMVADNYCFILDGDVVPVEGIINDHTRFWNQTSSYSRFYYSETLKTFHQVTMLSCRGSVRGAYRRNKTKGGGAIKVELEKVYKVSRYYSFWGSCKAFHRIISVVSPITAEGESACGFRSRIFVQYFWRTIKAADKARVLGEYADYYGRLTKGRDTGLGPSVTGSITQSNSSTAYSSRDSMLPMSARNSDHSTKGSRMKKEDGTGRKRKLQRSDTTVQGKMRMRKRNSLDII